MDLVVDANILFALLIKKGVTEKLFLSDKLHLYAPEYLFVEFRKHERDILEITFRPKEDFPRLIELLERRIELVPVAEFRACIAESESLLEDKDDAAYLAVCLAKKMPLWTNDDGFKKQGKVLVYTTQDIIRMVGID